MKTPDRVSNLMLECTCKGIGTSTWDRLMKEATRADKRKVNRLVRDHLPDLFYELALNEVPLKKLSWYNPYNYYKTSKHLVLVHSRVEYFIRYNKDEKVSV